MNGYPRTAWLIANYPLLCLVALAGCYATGVFW